MKAQNQKKPVSNPRLSMFRMLVAAFMGAGVEQGNANRRAYHQSFGGEHPDYTPRKHTVKTYGKQQREAKKRRAAR